MQLAECSELISMLRFFELICSERAIIKGKGRAVHARGHASAPPKTATPGESGAIPFRMALKEQGPVMFSMFSVRLS